MTIDIGSLGASTKWKELSAGSGSDPARTVPRTLADARVNCVKLTDEDACGAMMARPVSISWPSTVSVTGTSFNGWSPLLLNPAVTVIRSCPEKLARVKLTDGTDRFAVFVDA